MTQGRHSGARPELREGREPGSITRTLWGMDSGLAAYAAPRNDSTVGWHSQVAVFMY
jgi:hypothetical protein